MVAVRSADAERFINHPPPGVFLYLVFGSEAGLVAERMRTLLVRAVESTQAALQVVQPSVVLKTYSPAGKVLMNLTGRYTEETRCVA